jgi:hypothetical protein
MDAMGDVLRQGNKFSASRQQAKARAAKARLQDRFFKEIDTTMEALGIAAEAPGLEAAGPSGAGSGLPPSPAGSTLSLSLAPSADAPPGTASGGCSRASTPPLPVAGSSGGEHGPSGLGRR